MRMTSVQLSGELGRLENLAAESAAQLLEFLAQLVVFTVVFVALALVGRWLVVPLAQRVVDARHAEPTIARPTMKAVRGSVLVVAVGVAFAVAGFGNLVSATATMAAALTLAVGFASRDIISNIVGGLFMISDPKFNIGDWIAWNEREGVIEDISFRMTRIRTFDNQVVTVPNSTLINAEVTNYVTKPRLRIDLPITIGYDDDIDTARRIVLEEAERMDEILDVPEPAVYVDELADRYVGLETFVWIRSPSRRRYLDIRSAFAQAVKERCDEEDVELPYPQYVDGEVAVVERSERVPWRDG